MEQQKDLFSVSDDESFKIAEKLLGTEWAYELYGEFSRPYMDILTDFIKKEKENYIIRPDKGYTFRAFKACPFSKVKVIMVGQDPYPHNAADGLAFSSKNKSFPVSLKRIYTEIEKDTGEASWEPELSHWTEQGVLLLNKALTVRDGEPNSHHGKGWEEFISAVLKSLNKETIPTVFIFFGKSAQELASNVTGEEHLVIKASHPARNTSYAMNLKDQGYFKKINDFVERVWSAKIEW